MNINIVDFNPNLILLNFSLPGDFEVYEVAFADFSTIQNGVINKTILYSVGLACGIIFSIMLFVVHKNKRSPTFILNQATMVCFIIRCSLNLAYLKGPFVAASFQLTGLLSSEDYPKYKITIAANAFQTILILLIETTFVYQIYSVFVSPEIKKVGLFLTGVSICLGLTTVAWYIYVTIASSLRFKSLLLGKTPPILVSSKLASVPIILLTTTVNVMSLVLITKLAMAIRTRRYLGLKQFDSLHIVMIMMTQTFIVPSVLTIVNSSIGSSLGEENLLFTISMILIVLSLPLTSMWANAANNNPRPSSGTPFQFGTKINSFYSDSTGSPNTPRYSMFTKKLQKAEGDSQNARFTNDPVPTADAYQTGLEFEADVFDSCTVDNIVSIVDSDGRSSVGENLSNSNHIKLANEVPKVAIRYI